MTRPAFAARPRSRRHADRPTASFAAVELLEERRLLAAVLGEFAAPGQPGGPFVPGGGGLSPVAPAPTAPNPVGPFSPSDTGDYDGTGVLKPLGDTFFLHSNPGAAQTIFLDFDGHFTPLETGWSTDTGDPFVAQPFDVDGNPGSFSISEMETIQQVWMGVAEDFLPFDVNVTTQEPPSDALTFEGFFDDAWGVRAVIAGGTGEDLLGFNNPVNGIAQLFSFTASTDTPCFTFFPNREAQQIANTTTHEVGHTLGLQHDGIFLNQPPFFDAYYDGHGAGVEGFDAIMGAAPDLVRQFSIFSNGDYSEDATNFEDDLSVITSFNGFGYRADDFADGTDGVNRAFGSFSELTVGGVSQPGADPVTELSGVGIISTNFDADSFRFETAGGLTEFTILAAEVGANLNVGASIRTLEGDLIVEDMPLNDLNAFLSVELAAGEYQLVIDGVGRPSTAGVDGNIGFSDYGVLGHYRIAGTVANFVDPDAPPTTPPVAPPTTPPAPAGFEVVADSLVTSESGQIDTFMIRLTAAPIANVTVTMQVSDLTEAGLSARTLTFDGLNWDRFQTVTVFGLDDGIMDGPQGFAVSLAVSSFDALYNGFLLGPLGGVNLDNDGPGGGGFSGGAGGGLAGGGSTGGGTTGSGSGGGLALTGGGADAPAVVTPAAGGTVDFGDDGFGDDDDRLAFAPVGGSSAAAGSADDLFAGGFDALAPLL